MKTIFGFKNAYLALGANQPSPAGEPVDTLRAATQLLQEKGVERVKSSRLFRTPCFPKDAGPDFVNACCQVRFRGTAEELLATLHSVEAAMGRTRTARWSARTLDVDLLAVEGEILPDLATQERWVNMPLETQKTCAPEQLIVPHPRLQDRGFVLIPLSEVAPQWVHPVTGRTVAQMLESLPESEKEGVIALPEGL